MKSSGGGVGLVNRPQNQSAQVEFVSQKVGHGLSRIHKTAGLFERAIIINLVKRKRGAIVADHAPTLANDILRSFPGLA